MDLAKIRRENLRRWTARNGIPQVEKSYFSQLLSGASFGERAARRIERDYRMPIGSLDIPSGTTANEKVIHTVTSAKVSLSVVAESEVLLQYVTAREARLLSDFRASTIDGMLMIEATARYVVPKKKTSSSTPKRKNKA